MNKHRQIQDMLTKEEKEVFVQLSTPTKIQDFLNALGCNFETDGETVMSPRRVLQKHHAHCLEGALLAAAALQYHGARPLLLDLKSSAKDFDHVVALFKKDGFWGAISKTNHAVLRYREPIYETIRELALSYFHEYFTDEGIKTLRSFSKPFSLIPFGTKWIIDEEELWDIGAALDDAVHIPLLTKQMQLGLRRADTIEVEAGKLTQYRR